MSTSSRFKDDLIVRNQILAAQKRLEDKAKREWHFKWGFYLDFDKFLLEEARKRGISEEDYRRMVTKRKETTKTYMDCEFIKKSEKIPKTSAEFIGWRNHPNIDRITGPLHINPKDTLPKDVPQKFIFLG